MQFALRNCGASLLSLALLPLTLDSQLYYRSLSPNFKFRLPGLGERSLDKAAFFGLIFDQLLPSFPDLSFNAVFLTTTGLDDCAHVEIAVTGTHTGAPFSFLGLPPIRAAGRSIALPAEFLRIDVNSLTIESAAADELPGQPEAGFPTGIWLALGGTLPGF